MRRYAELWRLPSAPLLIVAGIVGRLPGGIAPLALLLFLADRTGSYGVAGVAVGIYGLATAAVAPLLGRIADRRGFTAVLVGTGVGYPLAVGVLVFTALTDTRFYGLNYNIPSLCFGASGAAMHGFNEYVDLDSLRQSTKATALFIAEWCGVEPS